jgi:Zn-finger nucleic acid-binding protein
MENSIKSRITAFNCPNCGAAVAPDSTSCIYCGSSIAVRVCPSCFSSVSVGMTHCPHCGAEVSNSEPGQTETFRCPCCEANLAPISVGKHSLQICKECGGLWADKNAFQAICSHEEDQEAVINFRSESSQLQPIPGPKRRRAYIPCPQCGKLMNQKNFSGCSGVVLDWCRDHGSWFDKDELRQIVTFIRNGGLRKAREREQANLQEQESRLRMQQFQLTALGRLDADAGKLDAGQSDDPLTQFLFHMFR